MSFKVEFIGRFRWIDGHADIAGLFVDGQLLAQAVAALAMPYEGHGVTKVAAVEARGFVLGSGVALRLGVGFVAIRKAGSIHPGPKVERMTAPDWRGREHLLQMQRSALGPGDVVLLVDDWAEVSSQATAAKALIEECGAGYRGCPCSSTSCPTMCAGTSSPFAPSCALTSCRRAARQRLRSAPAPSRTARS